MLTSSCAYFGCDRHPTACAGRRTRTRGLRCRSRTPRTRTRASALSHGRCSVCRCFHEQLRRCIHQRHSHQRGTNFHRRTARTRINRTASTVRICTHRHASSTATCVFLVPVRCLSFPQKIDSIDADSRR